MGKPKAPAVPDYTAQIAAAQIAAQTSDAQAARMSELGQKALDQQGIYAGRAADLAEKEYGRSVESEAFGRKQYTDLLPYLTKQLDSQLRYQDAGEKNLAEQLAAAQQARTQAAETYGRYKTTYAPKEDQFLQDAFGYASRARMEEAAGGARADVGTAFQAQRDRATRTLAGYGLDPTQGAFARAMTQLGTNEAAAGAAAGTLARRQVEDAGVQREVAALQMGQKLPVLAGSFATQGGSLAAGGLAGAGIGGAGISQGFQGLNAGTNAIGSPLGYAQLSNPYTQLSGAFGQTGGGLYGNASSLYGSVPQNIGVGTSAINTGFTNAFENYQQQSANNAALWQGIGSLVGAGGSAAILKYSDRRLKTNIVPLGRLPNGLQVYRYNLRGDPRTVVGLMADEVEQLHPEAVVSDGDGYKLVYYDRAVR